MLQEHTSVVLMLYAITPKDRTTVLAVRDIREMNVIVEVK